MYCKECGNDIGEELICPYCKKQSNYILLQGATHYSPSNQIADEPNVFMVILAFLIPLLGFIYYPTQIATSKLKSRTYGISSLCGLVGYALAFMIYLTVSML